MELGSIISVIAQNFGKLLPIQATIVHSYEQGVRFTFGKDTALLRAGLHFYLGWGLGSIETSETTIQVLPLTAQSAVTSDEKNIIVKFVIEFEVANYRTLITTVQDDSYEDSLSSKAMGFVLKHVHQKTYEEILESPDDLAEQIEEDLDDQMEIWGLNLHGIYVTDIVNARHFRFFTGE